MSIDDFNFVAHIKVIEDTVKELESINHSIEKEEPLSHLYIRVIINNTMVFLIASVNVFDGKNRTITFYNDHDKKMLMQAVHKSFFSSLLIAVEKGLENFCIKKSKKISSLRTDKANEEFKKLESMIVDTTMKQQLKKIEKFLPNLFPTFNDYLEIALRNSTFAEKQKKEWRTFFSALGVIRNKCSHSDTTLSQNDIKKLKDGGFNNQISNSNILVLNSKIYSEILNKILDFFSILDKC